MKKRIVLMTLGVGLGIYLSQPLNSYAGILFGGGAGTAQDPYQLSTPEHLTELQVAVDGGNTFKGKYFILTNNIDFEGYDNDNDPTNGNFNPIGYWYFQNNKHVYKRFEGYLDGQSFFIQNLRINLPKEEYVGLFATASGGTIANLHLKDVQITGKRIVGAIAGSSSSPISKCSVEGGSIEGQPIDTAGHPTYAVGGLVGYSDQLIEKSYTNVEVKGFNNVGGLVGFSLNEFYEFKEDPWHDIVEGFGEIRDSYVLGTVKGERNVGGLIGNSSSPIHNSYMEGTVEGFTNVGGLVGDLNGGKEDLSYPGATEYFLYKGGIEDSYFFGLVKGGVNTGGLVGRSSGPIARSYALGSVEGQSYTGGLVGYSFKGEDENDSSLIGNFSLTESFASNEVKGTLNVGGLLGFSSGSLIKNTYHLKSVKGVENVGGILGSTIVGKYQTQIENTYQRGEVSGERYVGDLLGYLRSVTIVDNAYHIGTISFIPLVSIEGVESQINNISRIKTADLSKEGSSDLFVGFDFDSVWKMNGGSPRFQWEDGVTIPDEQDAMVLVTGKINPLIAEITIPGTLPDLLIDPNLDEGAVSPEFTISNQTNSSIRLELKTFEQLTNAFNDVLPTKYESWIGLNRKQSEDLALGLMTEAGEGWQSLVTPTSYVANHTNHEIGVIKPQSSVDFGFKIYHGRAIAEPKAIRYRMIFVFDLLS